MSNALARKEIEKYRSDRRHYRILEAIPGALVWLTFAVLLILTFTKPLWAIFFIIIYDVLWLVRITYVLIYLLTAFARFRKAVKVDWYQKCQTPELREKFQKLKHLVIIPTFRDDLNVLESTIDHLTKVTVPLSSMFVVVAIEQRDGEHGQKLADELTRRYSSKFGAWLVSVHPEGIPGEMAGKGSNTTWAGRRAKEYIDRQNIDYRDVIVSAFDVDSCVHPQYFACLSHAFLTSPNPTRTSYQPIPLYNNNIWNAPPFTRVVSNSTTFWLLSETIRTERLFTFSSHSMSLQALVDVDFWQNDIVTEDSRIFLQCLMHYDGKYSVMPIYIPVSMDTVLGKSVWQTIEHQYKQIRRWAYGIENFPFMVWNFFSNSAIPFKVKFRYIWNQTEGTYSWSTAPIMIFVLGFLPLALAPDIDRQTTLYQSAPDILRILMTTSIIGLFASALMSIIILPKRPATVKPIEVLVMALQWVLLPITTIIFGSIPAIEAQTRLMTGRYLGFWPTAKIRKNDQGSGSR